MSAVDAPEGGRVERRGRLLALAILAGILILAGLVIVWPFWQSFAEREVALAQAYRTIGRFEAAIARRHQVQARVVALKAGGLGASGLYEGASAALAGARLQNDIRMIVEANGGELRSMSTRPPFAADGYEKLTLVCDFTLPVGKLKSLSYALETHQPYLFIEAVTIRMPEGWQPQDGGTAPIPRLELQATVGGYRTGEAP